MAKRRIILKNAREISMMRDAGMLVAETFQMLEPYVAAGITTDELDRIVEEYIRSHGAKPSFKGYRGFKGSICVAVNDEVVHGIPGTRVLNAGDIIAVDIGAELNGWHGDATITYGVGAIDADSLRLMDVCRASLDAGIEMARADNNLTDISAAIQKTVEQSGFNVVRDLYGHGLGRNLHEAPLLPHYGRPGRGPKLVAGMVITIEPMIVAGRKETVLLDDGWTIITRDGARSAQFEHSVAITNNGPLVLTAL